MNTRLIALPAALLLTLPGLTLFRVAAPIPTVHATPVPTIQGVGLHARTLPVVDLAPIVVRPTVAEIAAASR